MTRFALLVSLAACLLTTGCAVTPQMTTAETLAASDQVEEHQAVLFVSMVDGTVVRQMISSEADYCFKINGQSETKCLTQGEPIVNASGSRIIGYEMIENHLDLHAKQN